MNMFFKSALILFLILSAPTAHASEKQQEACKEKYLPKAETKLAFRVYARACTSYYEDKPKPQRVMDVYREGLDDLFSNCHFSNLDEYSKRICSFDKNLIRTSDSYFILTIGKAAKELDKTITNDFFYSPDTNRHEKNLQDWKDRRRYVAC